MGDGWSAPRPGRFNPRIDPVAIVQETGWAPGTVWTGAENLAPHLNSNPDRPARGESLYRLSYPGQLDSQPLTLWLRDACKVVMYRNKELSKFLYIGVWFSCLYVSTTAVLVKMLFVSFQYYIFFNYLNIF